MDVGVDYYSTFRLDGDYFTCSASREWVYGLLPDT